MKTLTFILLTSIAPMWIAFAIYETAMVVARVRNNRRGR